MHEQDKTKNTLNGEPGKLGERPGAEQNGPGASDHFMAPSNPRWHSLVANAAVHILILDRDHRIRFINRTDAAKSPDDVLGKTLYDFYPSEYQNTARECVERVFETGTPQSYEAPAANIDGRARWYGTHLGPIFEKDKVVAVSVIAENITARKQAEQERDRAHTVLNATIECLPFDLFAVGPDGRYMLANPVAKTPYGNIIGKTPAEVCPDERDLALWLDNNRRAFAGERVEGEVELRVHGETRHYYNIITPIRGDDELYGIVGVNVDITDRVRAERALRESEERYRLLVETIPYPVYGCEANGALIECNRRWYEYTGQTPEQAKGDGWMKALHPDDIPKVIETVTSAAAEGRAYESECRFRRASDGSYRWHLDRAIPMKDEDGKVVSWFGSAADIHDQKEAERVLKQSRDTLELRVTDRTAKLEAANEQLKQEIKRRHEVEKALRKSEGQYRTLVEASPDAVVVSDLTGQVLFASRRAAELLGFDSPEELHTKRIHDFVVEEERTRVAANLSHLVDVSVPGKTEYTGVRKDGTRFPVEVSSAVVRNGDEQAKALIAVVRDITERKEAQEALRQSYDELSVIYDGMVDGLLITDIETLQFARANESICRMLGYSETELLSLSIKDIHPAEAVPHIVEKIRVTPEVESDHTGSIPFLRRDGSVFYAEVIGKPLIYNGRPCSMGIFRDITERKQAEEALRQSHDELKTIYDETIEGLLITDIETKRFLRANTSMCRMLGYSMDELLTASIKDIHPPEEAPNDLQRFQAAAEGPAAMNEERPVLRKDGSIFYADISGHPIVYGGRHCLLAFFRDVTERKQAQQALERERQTLLYMLRASDHERQVIAYDIHDGLAQPLAAAIMQYQSYESLKDRHPRQAKTALDAGLQMLKQAHFEARRLISGVRPPILDESGIAAAISHLVYERSLQVGPRIELHSDLEAERLVPILENAIYRIAQEALGNACKHSHSEKVKVVLVQEGKRLSLEVQDWGVGFDPEAVPEDRFGLQGIRERTRLLGGELSISSEPGKGTCIRVRLPILEQD